MKLLKPLDPKGEKLYKISIKPHKLIVLIFIFNLIVKSRQPASMESEEQRDNLLSLSPSHHLLLSSTRKQTQEETIGIDHI